MRKHASAALVSLLSTISSAVLAAGPDVIVGFVDDGREDSRIGSKIGLTASTNSCNLGDAPLNWHALPDNRHPAITLNLYRLVDGRIEQLAKSWVKHGFFATNQNACANIPEMAGRTCAPGTGGTQLRPGCSDYYSEDLNADPSLLGPRSKITNSATGAFNGADAQNLTGYPGSQPAERILLVDEADLIQPGARYFVEGHYITADDALAGNARNNVTYREVKPLLRTGAYVLRNESDNVRTQPAILAWRDSGAQLAEIEANEGGGKTFLIVGSKASPAPGGKFRYDYVVYNMNSDFGVQSFSVPAAGIGAASVGFKAPSSNGEIWSNEAWQAKTDGGWFVGDGPPGKGTATLSRFKPVTAGTAQTATTAVIAPAK
jgi:hypothetical protein